MNPLEDRLYVDNSTVTIQKVNKLGFLERIKWSGGAGSIPKGYTIFKKKV